MDANLLDIGIAVIGGAAATAGAVWFKNKKSKESKTKEDPSVISQVNLESKQVREIFKNHGSSSRIKISLDPTKRKSLSPGNSKVIPNGWEAVQELVPESAPVKPNAPVKMTEKLKGEFAYKFFGSQLMLGDRILKGGLPRKLHLLEITTQDQIFIDGQPLEVHPKDIEDLKKVIRDAKLGV
jgi:hypothetical protein